MESVRHAIQHFGKCTPEERAALERDLDQLHAMAEKLAAGKVEIVVFGEISTGKSALINALVGQAVAEVNVRGGWTKDVWNVGWKGAGYCVPGLASSQVVLIDTPGLNEVDGAQRAAMAHEAASRADLVLFVTDSDLNEVEYSARN
jgi:predicted GTPase